jgi:Domain of unknown function (DUF4270)
VFPIRSLGIVISILLFATACTKIDTTRLGSDLIPDVDNVNTFDTLLDVTTRNFPFLDSTRLPKNQLHAVGGINNDPLFGSTKADIYMEMKPDFFPGSFPVDSLIDVDSVVLSLAYRGHYGDSSQPVTFNVYKVTDPVGILADTISDFSAIYQLNKTFITGNFLGSKSYPQFKNISDTVSVRRDSTNYKVVNQIRIVLNKADPQLRKVLEDTNALKSDSLFRTLFKGFKIEATVGGVGALAYINITDTATRLEYYVRKKNGINKIDTTSISLFNNGNAGHANNIVRNTAISEMERNKLSDSLLYIYTTPGSYGKITIPGLKNVTNRIIHRAELKIVQIPDDLSVNGKLPPPPYLYLDRYDTAIDRIKFSPIPFDLNPAASPQNPTNTSYGCFPSDAGIDYSYFGGVSPNVRTINGQQAYEYNFNLTRYIQNIVTKRLSTDTLRLSSAIFAEYFNCTGIQYVQVTGNRIAEGRIKLGGGATKGSPFPYKMQLRIIYSKL